MKNYLHESEIKDILNERKWEKRMDTIGVILTTALFTGALILIAHAFYVSKQIDQKHLLDGYILPRNDAQMLNGY